MSWSKVEGKMKPHYGTQLLCAWKNGAASSWTYDVLTHWPDGLWTDAHEEILQLDELPDYWQSISHPVDV